MTCQTDRHTQTDVDSNTVTDKHGNDISVTRTAQVNRHKTVSHQSSATISETVSDQ